MMNLTSTGKRILFFDMDGPLAEFENGIGKPIGHPSRGIWETDQEKLKPMYTEGFFRNLEVTKGAKYWLEKMRELDSFEIFIASNAMTDKVLFSPSEKYEWIAQHFPWLLKRIMLTCDKGLLHGHYLVDDNPHLWADKFQGTFIPFNVREPIASWKSIYDYFEKEHNEIKERQRVIEENGVAFANH